MFLVGVCRGPVPRPLAMGSSCKGKLYSIQAAQLSCCRFAALSSQNWHILVRKSFTSGSCTESNSCKPKRRVRQKGKISISPNGENEPLIIKCLWNGLPKHMLNIWPKGEGSAKLLPITYYVQLHRLNYYSPLLAGKITLLGSAHTLFLHQTHQRPNLLISSPA